MKKLNKFAVKSAMDLLIHSNSQTTTLEVKNALRDLEFEAKQSEISLLMNEIYSDNKDVYKRVQINTDYFIYTFTSDAEFVIGMAQTISDNSNSIDNVIDKVNSQMTAVNLKKVPLVETKLEAFHNEMKNSETIPGARMVASKDFDISNEDDDENELILASIINTVKADRDPLHIGSLSAIKNCDGQDNWVVYHKDGQMPYHLYDKSLTRDQVRSRYASLNACKMQDVRSCKHYNF